MAEEAPPVAPPVDAPAAVPSLPPTEAPASSTAQPAADAPASPAVAAAQPADAAPAAGTPPADAPTAPVDAASTPTLLQEAGDPPPPTKDPEAKPDAEAKPAEEKAAEKPVEKPAEEKPAEKPAETKAEEAAPPAETPPEPITYELKFGDIAAKPEEVADLTKLFSEDRIPADKAQRYIDLHIKQLNAFAERFGAETAERQQKAFGETRQGWRQEVMSDPEIGGAGHHTAMTAIARVRDHFVPADERQAFDEFCRYTGAGDNPAMLKMMHRMAAFLDEPAPPQPGTKPPPDIGLAPGSRRLRDHYTNGRGK